jgi:1-deoxy-D-xylulose-5-phosphate reductoisomerase
MTGFRSDFMQTLLILGSTGSIGEQCLDILREFPGRFQPVGLSACRSWEATIAVALEFDVPVVALADADAAAHARAALPASVRVLEGEAAATELARELEYDVALNGIVGAAGLAPSEAVLGRGKRLALANKESLVIAGALLMRLARETGAELLPVDSEHCALAQCLAGERLDDVRRVYLTASGGALRDLSLEELGAVTPERALAHPTWQMGPRITIGSATLMNKALEIIEAAHLWGLEAERIGVLIHRQSVVHGMIEYQDGALMAQLSPPDMRGPIHHALAWPERAETGLVGFDPVAFSNLTFEVPDAERFPALELGYRCVREGGSAGAVLNAADEVAVAAFLEGRLPFHAIVPLVESVLDEHPRWPGNSLAALFRADAAARALAETRVQEHSIRP